ncbi:MAG: LysM peptidoglycan-binding domain-containing protein [Anaerolineae bacterium]|nr:LysM peptidoglycan-binding domain-containing protein [Anaerolineae bacterium]
MRTRMILGAIVLALVLALIGGAVIPARAEGNLQPAAQAGWFYHTVKAGETVSGIALHYGVTTQAIINLNGLPWPYTIYSGKWLKIPTATYPTHPPMPAYRYHVVKWGETVSSIARWYGVTAQAIINANSLHAPYTIYTGQSLYIPSWGGPGPHPGPVMGRAYVVRPGDTLIRIGQWYGIPWGDIAWRNHLAYPYNIYVGQVLYIP